MVAYSADKPDDADAPLKPAADAQSMHRKPHHEKRRAVAHAKVTKASPDAGKTKHAAVQAKSEKATSHASKAKAAAAKSDE